MKKRPLLYTTMYKTLKSGLILGITCASVAACGNNDTKRPKGTTPKNEKNPDRNPIPAPTPAPSPATDPIAYYKAMKDPYTLNKNQLIEEICKSPAYELFTKIQKWQNPTKEFVKNVLESRDDSQVTSDCGTFLGFLKVYAEGDYSIDRQNIMITYGNYKTCQNLTEIRDKISANASNLTKAK